MRCAPHKPPLLYTGEDYSRFAPVCTDMWVPSDDGRLNRLSQTGLTLTPSAQWAKQRREANYSPNMPPASLRHFLFLPLVPPVHRFLVHLLRRPVDRLRVRVRRRHPRVEILERVRYVRLVRNGCHRLLSYRVDPRPSGRSFGRGGVAGCRGPRELTRNGMCELGRLGYRSGRRFLVGMALVAIVADLNV